MDACIQTAHKRRGAGPKGVSKPESGRHAGVPENRRARVQATEQTESKVAANRQARTGGQTQAPGKATRHRSVIDVTKPIRDVIAPEPAEQLRCLVKAGEEDVGSLDLPICDGFVPGYVIADAIAAEFAWQYSAFTSSARSMTLSRSSAKGPMFRCGADACVSPKRSRSTSDHSANKPTIAWVGRSSCRSSGAARTGQLHRFTMATPFVHQSRSRASQTGGRL